MGVLFSSMSKFFRAQLSYNLRNVLITVTVVYTKSVISLFRSKVSELPLTFAGSEGLLLQIVAKVTDLQQHFFINRIPFRFQRTPKRYTDWHPQPAGMAMG